MEEETMEKKENNPSHALIPGSIIFAGVIIAAAVLYTSSNKAGLPSLGDSAQVGGTLSQETPSDADIEDDDPFLGNPDAPITLVEFSDFQCPFCAKFFFDAEAEIIKKYVQTGKVKFVYRDFPLTIHPMAQKAAEAGECADEQKKFWEYHDTIFQRQSELSLANLKAWARELGLDGAQFDACLDFGKYFDEVRNDLDYGQSIGVGGTPAIFINGRFVPGGAQPFPVFERVIEQELKKQ